MFDTPVINNGKISKPTLLPIKISIVLPTACNTDAPSPSEYTSCIARASMRSVAAERYAIKSVIGCIVF